MAPRKTVKVADILKSANRMLSQPDAIGIDGVTLSAEVRTGIAHLLESVLFATDTYAGYGYQASELTTEYRLKDGYDHTRRVYRSAAILSMSGR